MEFESTNSGTTTKLPILKLGEYETWVIRIKQYFQIQDYALWEVIENGDSWVSVPQTVQENGTSVTKMSIPVTAEEKTNKKNDVKARRLLLMALPNDHQLTFTTKKTQKALLKQQYENFSVTSAESLDFIFNRLQKIVSRLAILGVVIAQEDLNSKFLSSLPFEWNTHVVVWMNKPEVETMSIDDLYNNFKIVEQKVKKFVGASSGAQNLAFMTTLSTSSTNDANTASLQVSTASPNVNAASPQDLEKIHKDDLEAMDLKWKLSLLSVRAKKYYQRTNKKIFINSNDTAGYDKTKVECYNYHKLGHFARECRAPKSKDGQFRNQDNTRKQGNNEDKYSKAMLAIDGVGFDWSDMAEEQCDDLLIKLNESEFKATTYKRGLATLEDQIVTYKKNEVLFTEEIGVRKREVACKDYEINMLKSKFEKVKQEKDGIEFKIEKFDKASKDLDYLDEFKEHEFKGYGPKNSEQESNVVCDKKSYKENSEESLVEEQVSQDTSSFVESSPNVDKETIFPVNKKVEFTKPKNHEKPVKKSVRPVNTAHPKTTVHSAKSKSHFSIPAQSTAQRPFYKQTALTKRSVHTANRYYYTRRPKAVNTARFGDLPNLMVHHLLLKDTTTLMHETDPSKPQHNDKGFIDSGCSRHITGNIAYLSDFKEFDGGYVAFGGGAYGGRITGKGTLKTNSLDFEDVYFVNELKFNLFSVSQMCDKKNYVLFTNTECLVLSPNFKLPDENQILLKILRKGNMYNFDIKNIVSKESLTCLVAKATLDESMLWNRRLGHINFKTINKLVKDNLVRGLPTKRFENDQTCVACLKGKQHRASCKSKFLNPITKPLFMLHMYLFGPTFVSSLMHKKYCLVVTDDYSRFTWVFFLTTKDETSEILKNFIKEIENLVDKKVKIIRSDNGTEFKNKVMDDFCREKGIKREYSVARTPQQNGVAERRNRTLIEAARTMLADSKLPTTFWAEAVSTACYVQNRVLVVKPHNKTPYELFRGFKPALSFMRPFGCHVTILNTLDSLGKFDGKSDEGFFVGYSLSSKAFRVYNTRTRRVEENLHIGFLENKPMIEGNGPKWLFDIDSLTQSMNYVPVTAGTISNDSAGTSEENSQDCIVMLIWKDTSYFDSPTKDVDNGEPKTADDAQKQVEDGPNNENAEQEKFADDSSTKDVNAAGQHVNTASTDVNTGSLKLNVVGPSVNTASSNEHDSPEDMFTMGVSSTLEATHIESFSDEDEPEVDLGNITNSYTVPTTPNTRIHKDHPIDNVIGDVKSTVQTRRMTKPTSEQGFLSDVYEQKTHDTLNTCLYACFLSQIEPTSIAKALSDSSWVEAMHEELLQFKLQQVWIVVDLPNGKKAIGTKWVFRNKKDERGIVIRNKARGKIDQTLFIKKQKGDILLVQVYVDDIIFGSTNKELCTGFEKLMKDKFQMSSMGELTFFLGLQVQQKEDGIFISQDKYVAEILKKFNYSDVKSASTPVDLEKPLVKDGDADDVDVHLYRSMIGSLMYLTASRPDIMFAVCACARFQVTPKTSHLLAVKRIFRYLKGKPTLGLWYSRDSPFELVAYTDSDYAGATQDRKSTTGGCQFLGNRLISWQCKKQTVVATSTTEAEYVAAASCCGQVLWIQNQLLDYGYNFMNTVINIDNNSTICIIENPVQHSKTKHIEIRHHFIRDCNAKKLIQMVKIHTDYNVADLLTKGFDAGRFQYLVSSIGMLNP
ncbi:putative ribonuclease H-like domain-containing protein [Tanacetum coccineum]